MSEIDAFLKLSASRVSCRDYKPDAVPKEAIEKCLEAARLAPSACNKQPWRFIVVQDRAKLDAICGKALLPGLPMPWLKKAPVIVALCSQRSVETHWLAPLLSGVQYDLLDCGIAGEHFILAAQAQGLGSCWIGWFRPGPLKRILEIPRTLKPLSLISLGYPAGEGRAISRKGLSDIASWNVWGSPFNS
jgi:nitroreductase